MATTQTAAQVYKEDDKVFPDKYKRKVSQEFLDAVDQMEADDIKQRILTCEGHLYEIDNAKNSDAKLNAAKEMSKELSGPYREAKTEETAKLKYCLFVLEQRGIDISG